jgi:tetratricopeptide (TPR) repeat protein
MRLSTFGRRNLIALLAAGVLIHATPALSQVRRIQGKVVDEEGRPVAGAAIEVTVVPLARADAFRRTADQTWRAQTNATGDYIITVPGSGEYVVTATKEGVGTDRTTVGVLRNSLITANLTLWRAPAPPIVTTKCGTSSPIGASERSPLAAGADAGLARLLGWLESVQLHTPGCGDSPALEVGRWALRDLNTLLRDVRELVTFLQRVEEERAVYTARGSTERDRLIFFIYDRRFTLDELERGFYANQPLRANDVLLRGAVLHADIGIFVPGELGRYPLVQDGGRRGWRGGSSHWDVGRQLLDSITPAPSADADALLWYRAVSAHLFRAGNLAELAAHLSRARAVFPKSPDILFDSACLHQELSSPPIQASIQQLRADSVSVAVNSRRSELERAERFLREALELAPGDASARLRLGHTLGELGRHKEAAAELLQAIDAKPDKPRLYLAELFLGRAEAALGRRDEARRRYERAASLYPNAQSPLLALSGLARQAGDRASAQRSLASLAAVNDSEPFDPWWDFYQSHKDDAGVLMARMQQIGR